MKRAITTIFGFFLLATPMLALADTLAPAQTLVQYTTVLANLEAQQVAVTTGQSIACAVVFSKSSVQVNQLVALGWGSVGAMNPGDNPSISMWSQNGGAMLSFTQAGTWTYSFMFYAKSGATTTCTAKIVVLQ
jgi:hypothetical protein